MIHVSAGIVRRPDGAILIARRGEGRKNAHLWEFPGGKQEKGETPESCLKRELLEELSLPISQVKVLCRSEAQGMVFTFLTAQTQAQPILTEHEAFAFVPPPSLLDYDFCPADAVVAQQLAFADARCYLWDFDGTLMDTYPLLTDVFCRTAEKYGASVTPQRALSLMKNNLRFACETVAAQVGASPEAWMKDCALAERAHLLDDPKPVEGIPELLRTLHDGGGRHYVVTHRERVCRDMLERCGLLTLFSGFVTREDALPRKPEPDMVLHCMQRYGLNPAQCVMIGDRPLDTQAGRAAGIRTVLLDADGRFPEEKSADIRVATVTEMQQRLHPDWQSIWNS